MADREIRKESQRSRERTGMSTRLSACMIDDALQCTVLDTGEGSMYIIDEDGIQVPGERARRTGAGSRTGGQGQWGDNCQEILSHTLGAPRVLREDDITTIGLGDSFLLLNSDGLHDFVKKEKIREIVMQNQENLEAACQALIHQALEDGSDHTISVILIGVG